MQKSDHPLEPETAPGRRRFLVPAVLAVTVLACGPTEPVPDAGPSIVVVDAGMDGGLLSCSCGVTCPAGACIATGTGADGGLTCECADV